MTRREYFGAVLQDCQPLWLSHPASGDKVSFAGAKEVVGAAVEATDAFSPLTAIGTGDRSYLQSPVMSP